MKEVDKVVKSKDMKEPVTIQVPVLEDQEDLEAYIEQISLAGVLALINRQVATDLANAERAKHREAAPGKGKMYKLGLQKLIAFVFSDGEAGAVKLQKCADLSTEAERSKAIDALILSDEIQNAVKADLEG